MAATEHHDWRRVNTQDDADDDADRSGDEQSLGLIDTDEDNDAQDDADESGAKVQDGEDAQLNAGAAATAPVVVEFPSTADNDACEDDDVKLIGGHKQQQDDPQQLQTTKQRANMLKSMGELLRTNPAYVLLWFALTISQLGDWFTDVALIAVLKDMTGTQAGPLGGLWLTWLVGPTFMVPIAGMIADRWNRLRVMVWSDLLRAALVLSYLFVEYVLVSACRWGAVGLTSLCSAHSDASKLWVLFVGRFWIALVSSVFEPSRTAVLPQLITNPLLLAIANTLDGMSSSTARFAGSAMGGLVSALLGPQWNFMIDSASYVVSAACVLAAFWWYMPRHYTMLAEVELPTRATTQESELSTGTPRSTGEFVEPPAHSIRDHCTAMMLGWRYLVDNPDLMVVTLFKSLSNIPMYLFLLGEVMMVEQLFTDIPTTTGVGIVMAGEAAGDILAPIIAVMIARTNPYRMKVGLAFSYALTVLGFAVGALAGNVWWLALGGFLAGASWGIQYGFTTTLLQLGVPNRVQGRVFAFSLGLRTLAAGVGAIQAALMLDVMGMTVRELFWFSAASIVVLGIVWTLWYMPRYGHVQYSRGTPTRHEDM